MRATKSLAGTVIAVWNIALEIYEIFSQKGYRFEGIEDEDGNLYGPDDLREDVTAQVFGQVTKARKALGDFSEGVDTFFAGARRIERPKVSSTHYMGSATVAELRVMAQALNLKNYTGLKKEELKKEILATKGLILPD